MRYIGVDPGANFTGVAVLDVKPDGEQRFTCWGEYSDPVTVWKVIALESERGSDLAVAVEDFLGGGYRDKHVIRTIQALGYLVNRCREAGIDVDVPANSARLGFVTQVPSEITGKDEISAAAHALSLRYRWEVLWASSSPSGTISK